MNESVLRSGDSKTISSKSFSKQTTNSDGVLITVVMTSKMINEEKKSNGREFWPKDAVVRGKNAFRTMEISDSDDNGYINWLDSYGCLWEKI